MGNTIIIEKMFLSSWGRQSSYGQFLLSLQSASCMIKWKTYPDIRDTAERINAGENI